MKRFLTSMVVFIIVVAAHAANPDRVITSYGQRVFLSGINVAWKQFGGDVGRYPIDTVWFAKMLQGVADSGGNVIRWWLFTDCSNDPQIDSKTNLVTGLETSTVANVKKVLDMGYMRGVSIDLCLLSFDMMKTGKTQVNMTANKMILQTDEGRKAFIDNAVVPLVKAIGPHPAIACWEVFNEPEGMVKAIAGDWGSMENGIEITDVQKTVNQVAGAIHRAMPGVPVSNGCWSFIAGSNTISGQHNYYSDSALIATGGDPDGTLDFYMVHYYEWGKTEISPFHHPASYWGLDKPLVIGEFPAKGLSDAVGPMTPAQCWKYLMDNGYAGAMGWTYTAHDGFGGLDEAGQGMRALKTTHEADVTLDFPPTANDDWYIDTTGKVLSVAKPGILVNDREPTEGQEVTASVLIKPQHGTLELKADGSFTYTPSAGWTGTDRFTYIAVGGSDAKDTASVSIRVLDPSKSAFFAPPKAKDWQIYSGWGTISLTDRIDGMGVNNPQWGSESVWVVGGGVPVTLTASEQTVSVQVKNDPGSPWAVLKFHLTTKAAVGNYGPADSTNDIIQLAAQSTGSDGFTEYRGTMVPKNAGTYLLSLQFIWQDTDGNGPNTNHQSLIRDFEICPSYDFVKSKQVNKYNITLNSINCRITSQSVIITSQGNELSVKIMDLRGRQVALLTGRNIVQWNLPQQNFVVYVITITAGLKTERFLVQGNQTNRLFVKMDKN